jgi:hypothetical protein
VEYHHIVGRYNGRITTAKALGIAMPSSLLALANEMIE